MRQFLLTRLLDGRTRLEGTAWYQNDLWPSRYQQQWSDQIIHRIQMQVLDHLKRKAEEKKIATQLLSPLQTAVRKGSSMKQVTVSTKK